MTLWKTLVGSIAELGEEKKQVKSTASQFKNPQKLKDGFIWSEDMILPRPCTIRDMSPLTATIDLWHDDVKGSSLRGKMKLFSCADQKEVDCIIAGRSGNRIQLRFMGALRAPSRKYA